MVAVLRRKEEFKASTKQELQSTNEQTSGFRTAYLVIRTYNILSQFGFIYKRVPD